MTRSSLFTKLFTFIAICVSFLILSPSAQAICCKCASKLSFDTTATTCLTVANLADPLNCTTLPNEQKATDYTCEKDPLTEAQCKKIVNGGICTNDPVIATASKPSEAATPATQKTPEVPSLLPQALKFNTPIPGFVAPTDMGLLFATYIAALYRYIISICVFLTTVMFIWGAFRYFVGSSLGSTSRGKAIMKDAIIGLLLALSANLILRTINPALVTLNSVSINDIQSVVWKPIDSAFNTSLSDRRNAFAKGVEAAKATNIPELPCLTLATIAAESGGNYGAIGHDEDASNSGSRSGYVKRGKTYLASIGDPRGKTWGAGETPPKNDDHTTGESKTFDINNPPNYGLDLQFSHGFGLSQATVTNDPAKWPPCAGKETAGPGFPAAGSCFTIPELLTPEGGAATVVDVLKKKYRAKGSPKDEAGIRDTFRSYIGPTAPDSTLDYRWNIYSQCMAAGVDVYATKYTGKGGGSKGSGAYAPGAKVLLFGDSLACGLGPKLQGLIKGNFSYICHVGVPIGAYLNGEDGTKLDAKLAEKPAFIFVSLGTNNEYAPKGVDPKNFNNVPTAQASYNALMKKLDKTGADIIWILPPQLPDYYAGGQSNRVNGEAVEDILKKTSKYFESESVTFTKRPANEIHPTAEYGIWADAIYAWFAK